MKSKLRSFSLSDAALLEDQFNRTVVVLGVRKKTVDAVSKYLENKRTGGGRIEWCLYNKSEETLTVRFEKVDGMKYYIYYCDRYTILFFILFQYKHNL